MSREANGSATSNVVPIRTALSLRPKGLKMYRLSNWP